MERDSSDSDKQNIRSNWSGNLVCLCESEVCRESNGHLLLNGHTSCEGLWPQQWKSLGGGVVTARVPSEWPQWEASLPVVMDHKCYYPHGNSIFATVFAVQAKQKWDVETDWPSHLWQRHRIPHSNWWLWWLALKPSFLAKKCPIPMLTLSPS